ncbi:esterase-5B-like [Drosophila montana]|uniref:esterase-5B-like n=1 Tax=Drosophila montana TaxID=40370 RepID=UPI00313E344E
MFCGLLWMCLLCLHGPEFARADPLLVELANGKLRGKDNVAYYSYESIPYAEPPLGTLRFEPPQPYKRQWTETFDASQPPEFCLQWNLYIDGANKLLGTEDCLTVSVYRPKNVSRSSFPVLAFIHGGGFMFGGAEENGHEYIMSTGNIIMVKISYRVGPLGFLSAGDAHFPGNFGLKDQRLALHWIKQNIASFGGEPENIMLIGHSAGGASVHLQLLHGGLEGLIKAAASLSGNALDPWAQQHYERQKAFELGYVLDCKVAGNSVELKQCLQAKDAKDIVSAVPHFLVFGYVPFAPFGPVVEAANTPEPFLTQQPAEIMASGSYSHIPWLLSCTANEGGFNAALFLDKQDNGKELIEVLNTRWNELAPDLLFYRHTKNTLEELNLRSQELKRQYLGDRDFSSDSYWDMQRMFTDLLFKNSVQRVLDLQRQHSQSPLYSYVYDNPADSGIGHWQSRRKDVFLGTVHCDDLFLIVNNSQHPTLRADEKIISKNLLRMIVDFVESDQGTLTYDNCAFTDIAGQGKVELLSITREGCENKQVEELS